MHYVRFLKVPQIQGSGSERRIAVLVTLTTDLGDAYYPNDLNLDITVRINDAGETDDLAKQRVQWKAGMRALPVELKLRTLTQLAPCFIEVRAHDESLSEATVQDEIIFMPTIIAGRSIMIVPPRGPVHADSTIVRNVNLGQGGDLLIWEESGDSIAHHVWDAGMATAVLLAQVNEIGNAMPALREKLGSKAQPGLQILELGTGTGIAGLAFAKMVPNSTITLTDVAESKGLVSRNISSNKVANGASVHFQPLDWTQPISEPILDQRFDVIVASDVTYNPDSGSVLIKTLTELVRMTPKSLILLAMKTRHPSEAAFFSRMKEANLVIVEQIDVLARSPHDPNDDDTAERISFYCFQKQ